MKNEKTWKTKEVVVAAMVSVVIGILFILLDLAYMPLSAVLGAVFMEILFGVYMLSATLPAYIMQKPGFALFGAIVAAGVNILGGSAYGIQVLLAALLQGVAAEIVFAGRKYKYSDLTMYLAGILMAIFVFVRDYFVFGYSAMPVSFLAGLLAVRLVSAVFIGTYLTKGISLALVKTGALKNYNVAKTAKKDLAA
mgnify:CR=1 FL=1